MEDADRLFAWLTARDLRRFPAEGSADGHPAAVAPSCLDCAPVVTTIARLRGTDAGQLLPPGVADLSSVLPDDDVGETHAVTEGDGKC